MSKIGISGAGTTPLKAEQKTKEFKFKEFSKELVKQDLEKQIEILINGRNNYITAGKLSANYLLTNNAFREKCFEDDELSNLYSIYIRTHLEHIMMEAFKTGKVNAQTETFLRDELQAFTGSGFEQNIKWVLDKGELNHRDTGESFEIEADIDKKVEDKGPLLWESKNEDDKE